MKFIALGLFLLSSVTVFSQQSISFYSPSPAVGTYSNSSAWDTAGGYKFEVGAFTAGFTPTALNESSWATNWTVAAQGATGLTTWIDDGGDTGFTGAARITVLSAPFTANTALYIWGYDSKAAGSRQWILLSNTAWLVAADISSPISTDLVVNASTTTVVGSISNAGATLQSALVVISAIPEPSAYAALLGAATLGLGFFRRRNKAA